MLFLLACCIWSTFRPLLHSNFAVVYLIITYVTHCHSEYPITANITRYWPLTYLNQVVLSFNCFLTWSYSTSKLTITVCVQVRSSTSKLTITVCVQVQSSPSKLTITVCVRVQSSPSSWLSLYVYECNQAPQSWLSLYVYECDQAPQSWLSLYVYECDRSCPSETRLSEVGQFSSGVVLVTFTTAL